MTDDLVPWLKRQLDQDERVAKACQDEVGTTRVGEMYPDGSGPAEQDDFPSYPYGSGEHELAFFARNDPARVLRDVESKRAILDEVIGAVHGMEGRIDEEWNAGREPEDHETSELLLKLLALPYSDRPGWREEWLPGGGS